MPKKIVKRTLRRITESFEKEEPKYSQTKRERPNEGIVKRMEKEISRGKSEEIVKEISRNMMKPFSKKLMIGSSKKFKKKS